jgi:peptidoglycan/LPS O-acetylase OafA/YrhL
VQKLKGHIPVLDGIRGLAIVMVLIAHFATLLEVFLKNYYPFIGPIITKLALAGLMGVDLFFVLSGFLITGILLDTKGTERYFTNFYARRFLRIFPLYYGVLFLLFFVLPKCISFDAAATEISANQWWLWAYLTNFPGHPVLDNSKIFLLSRLASCCLFLLKPAFEKDLCARDYFQYYCRYIIQSFPWECFSLPRVEHNFF